jgi:hypothetical protein
MSESPSVGEVFRATLAVDLTDIALVRLAIDRPAEISVYPTSPENAKADGSQRPTSIGKRHFPFILATGGAVLLGGTLSSGKSWLRSPPRVLR